jgi:hypothetical protein
VILGTQKQIKAKEKRKKRKTRKERIKTAITRGIA